MLPPSPHQSAWTTWSKFWMVANPAGATAFCVVLPCGSLTMNKGEHPKKTLKRMLE